MIKTLIFMLLPFAALSQRYTVLDTAYTVQDNLFYEVREVTYSSGESSYTKTLIGDSSAVFNAAFVKFQDESNRMAHVAQQVFGYAKALNAMKKESDYVLSITGKNPLDTITARQSDAALAAGWTIRDTSALDIEFSVNANGQLRYQIQGQTTRNADHFGSAIILNNYLSSGKDRFFFKTESGNFRTLDGAILLRKPGGALQRATVVPVIEPVIVTLVKEQPTKRPPKKAKKKKQ